MKTGDRVRCVNPCSYLTLNKIYTIIEVMPDLRICVCGDDSKIHHWYAWRFVKAPKINFPKKSVKEMYG